MARIPAPTANRIVEWTHLPGDKYLLCGSDTRGRKFRKETTNPRYALGINMYQGRLYLVRGGKRRLLKRVIN